MTARRENIQQAHYDAAYSTTANRGPNRLQNTVLALLNACPVQEGSSVLDIGAGRGELLARLPQKCSKFAVDISTVAAQQLVAKGIRGARIDLDTGGLPFASEIFDYVFCLEVLEHLIRPQAALQEARRTLKPSGKLIVSVPNIYQLCTLALFVADIPPVNSARYGHIHVNDFTSRLFKRALRENGFIVRRLAGDEIFPFTDPLTRWVARRVPRLAHHLVAVCEIAP